MAIYFFNIEELKLNFIGHFLDGHVLSCQQLFLLIFFNTFNWLIFSEQQRKVDSKKVQYLKAEKSIEKDVNKYLKESSKSIEEYINESDDDNDDDIDYIYSSIELKETTMAPSPYDDLFIEPAGDYDIVYGDYNST